MRRPSRTDSLYSRIQSLLQKAEADLLAQLDTAEAVAPPAPEGAEVTDFKEAAERQMDGELQEAQRARLLAELAHVRAARQRLNDSSYGFCEDCGDPIHEQRLLAVPSTTRCQSCQAAHEARHPHAGPGAVEG